MQRDSGYICFGTRNFEFIPKGNIEIKLNRVELNYNIQES